MESNQRKRGRNIDSIIIVALLMIILAIVFELYGHYAYVRAKGQTVVRVDRVTGSMCTMPCDEDAPLAQAVANAPAPSPSPSPADKTCHTANVVRVANGLRIPAGSRPVSYGDGGFDPSSAIVRGWKRYSIPFASELSDGHVYSFSRAAYAVVNGWSTGDTVEVCATWSRIERRPFYSVGGSDDAEAAYVAI